MKLFKRLTQMLTIIFSLTILQTATSKELRKIIIKQGNGSHYCVYRAGSQAYNACINEIENIQDLIEEYDKDVDNGSIALNISSHFSENKIALFKKIIQHLATCQGKSRQEKIDYLKEIFKTYPNDMLIKIGKILDFISIPVYQQAFEHYFFEHLETFVTLINKNFSEGMMFNIYRHYAIKHGGHKLFKLLRKNNIFIPKKIDFTVSYKELVKQGTLPEFTQQDNQVLEQTYKHTPYNIFKNIFEYLTPTNLTDEIVRRIDHLEHISKIPTRYLLNNIMNGKLVDALERYAYQHAHEERFEDWLNVAQKNAALLGKLMQGVQRRAQDMWEQHQLDTEIDFENMPETILKMMLRFVSNNELRDDENNEENENPIDITRFLEKIDRMELSQLDLSITRIQKLPDGQLIILYDEKTFINILLCIFTLHGQNITTLKLSANFLTYLPDFSNLENLFGLDVSSNKLTTITNFSAMPNMLGVLIKSNNLTSLSSFNHMPKLQTLFASKNKIERIDSLENNPNLRKLDLSCNQIEDLPNLKYLKKLGNLDLSANKIKQLTPLELENLKVLNIWQNQLENISNCCKQCPALEVLDASYNNLTTVDTSQLPKKLIELNVSKNPLKEDVNSASLQNLKWFNNRQVKEKE